MKIRWSLVFLGVLLSSLCAYGQLSVPSGTIIPVRLDKTVSSRDAKPNEPISARVMQDVPLPGGRKIREGTRVAGHVIETGTAAKGGRSSISFVFDRVFVSRAGFPVATDLRALASMTAVDAAMIPPAGMGEGDTWNARTTVQIGGDTVYWGGGPVVSRSGAVGKPLDGADSGVLVRVSANPEGRCRGEIGDSHDLQALWVFSSDACGVYGLDGVVIAHAGRTEPVGVITLTSQDREFKVGGGSGMLLRVVEPLR